MKRWIALLGLLFGLGVQPSLACKFCCGLKSPTLREDAAGARMIGFGTVANPRKGHDGRGNPTPEGIEGTTDFIVQQARQDDGVGDLQLIELPRYIAVDPKKKNQYLIFFDVHNGQLNPFKGLPATPALVDYLWGMLALDQKNPRQILAYAFRHLEHADLVIAEDAFREFATVSYVDYRELASRLRPDLLARWLQDPAVPAYRKGLYALLLGHCGTGEHAKLVGRLLQDARKQDDPGLDQLLIGYTLLSPKDGWELTQALLKDRSLTFVTRYRAQLALRFFWDSRPELVARKELLEAICLLLDYDDMADLAINDLLRWQQWEPIGRVLTLRKQKSHDTPIIRRAILRYALCCPHPEAIRYVQQLRKQDPELVQETEELLRLEAANRPTPRPQDS